MDGDTFDALVQRALGNESRRGVLRAGIGALAASALTAFGLNGAEEAQAKKHKKKGNKKKKKKKPYKPSAAYNTCLAEVPLLCSMAGCASRDQSPGCGACYADVEVCCQQALISKGADCACINTLPGFFCFGG
jgi:hypothetical protein